MNPIKNISLLLLFSSFVCCKSALPVTPADKSDPGGASATAVKSAPEKKANLAPSKPRSLSKKTAAEERDDIYTLMAYAVVHKNWQTKSTSSGGRGHNIGSVLVDPDGKVVSWARNCNGATSNGTQHGEVRLMTQYQSKKKLYNLKSHTIYTSLEPCAMCSGMMVMQNVGRTVYGQTDLGFGKAMERLQYSSAKYKPYPRSENLPSEPAKNGVRVQIDEKFAKYNQEQGGKANITEWLRGSEAEELYRNATAEFLNYQLAFEENRDEYEAALKLYDKVPSSPEE